MSLNIIVATMLLSPWLQVSGQDGQMFHYKDSDTIFIDAGAEPEYPPFCFLDEFGNPDGFAVDVFKAAARSVNIQFEFKVGVWGQIREDLALGKVDALPFVGRTPEREDQFDFTMSYLSLHGDIFVRKRTSDIKNLEDLIDKNILVMKGDNAEEFVRRDQVSNYIFTTNTYQEAFEMLSHGQYDAVITQRITGIRLTEQLGIKNVVPLNIFMPEFRQDFCFAVQDGNHKLQARLNEGLSVIIANGTYEEIRNNWLGPGMGHEFRIWDVLKVSLYILVPLVIIFLLVSIVILRRLVRRRTNRLELEISGHKVTAENLHKQKLLLNEMERISKTGGWEFDNNKKHFRWTEGTYEIYGLDKTTFDIGEYRHSKDFFHPDDLKILEKSFDRLLEEGTSYELELRFTSVDKVSKLIMTNGFAEVHHGIVVRAYGNIMDITERKKNEKDLNRLKDHLEKEVNERTIELKEKIQKLDKSQQAMLYMVEDLNQLTSELQDEREKLVAANRELEAFTYSVSHDLRAPLRAINGFSKFLHDDYGELLDDEGIRLLTVIRDNAIKMDILITDLLNFSRISRTGMKKMTIDMKSVAESMYYEIASDQQREDFELVLNEIPEAYCDNALMKQVWQNLIGNALKYSGRAELKKLEIGATLNGDEWVYYIRDHGAGFDPRFQDKLFTMFQRLHSDEEYEGTGVGLAIVQRIIQRHNGKIWAESEPGNGATFYFSLPNKLD
ncbi:MAG: transporter substrate-binding domain-containing protein [Bacteroidales bacterium]